MLSRAVFELDIHLNAVRDMVENFAGVASCQELS